jgi:hypothetical protein
MIEFGMSLFFGTIFGIVAYYMATKIKQDIPTLKVDPYWCAVFGFAFGWLGLLGCLFYIFYRVVQAQRLNK